MLAASAPATSKSATHNTVMEYLGSPRVRHSTPRKLIPRNYRMSARRASWGMNPIHPSRVSIPGLAEHKELYWGDSGRDRRASHRLRFQLLREWRSGKM